MTTVFEMMKTITGSFFLMSILVLNQTPQLGYVTLVDRLSH